MSDVMPGTGNNDMADFMLEQAETVLRNEAAKRALGDEKIDVALNAGPLALGATVGDVVSVSDYIWYQWKNL